MLAIDAHLKAGSGCIFYRKSVVVRIIPLFFGYILLRHLKSAFRSYYPVTTYINPRTFTN